MAELFLGRTDEYMRVTIESRLPGLPPDWERRLDERYAEVQAKLEPVDGIREALEWINDMRELPRLLDSWSAAVVGENAGEVRQD